MISRCLILLSPIYILLSLTFVFRSPAEAVSIHEHTKSIEQASPEYRHTFYLFRARAYIKENKYDLALNDINDSIRLKSTYAAYKERAELYFKMNRHQDAINDLTAILDVNPRDMQSYKLRSQSYYATNSYENALADAQRVLAMNPNDSISKKIVNNLERTYDPPKKIIIRPSYVPQSSRTVSAPAPTARKAPARSARKNTTRAAKKTTTKSSSRRS